MMKFKNSLIMKITVGSAIVVIVLFAVMIINYFYSTYVVRNNIIMSKNNTLDIYINNMDNILTNAVNDLDSIITNIGDFSGLVSLDESIRYFSSISVFDVLTNRLHGNNYSDALIVSNKKSDVFVAAFEPKIKYQQKEDMIQLVKEDILDITNKKKGWSIVHRNERVYFYKIYQIKTTYIISFVTPASLMSLVGTTTAESEIFILTDLKGRIISHLDGGSSFEADNALPNDQITIRNYKGQYLLISKDLGMMDARLSVILRETSVLSGLSSIQWIIIILGFVAFIITPFFIYFLNKEIIRPINSLLRGIRKIEGGDMEHRVEQRNYSVEFTTLTKAFNNMLNEIEDLKINYYEEQIELQKSEIRYLQIQLRPHFYLNALTTIHSLSFKNNNELIRRYIDSLSIHLRYILKGAMSIVTIKDELKHVKNYIVMQEIRFPGSVFYMVDTDRELDEVRIPLMLILTFVENAFKHAMILDDTLYILIKIEKVQWEQGEAVRITIEDNGEGFPKKIIKSVNNDQDLSIKGKKIGIFNIKRTLKLLYERENLLKLGKADPDGAKIEIIIPLGV